jgi:hypothetical protein
MLWALSTGIMCAQETSLKKLYNEDVVAKIRKALFSELAEVRTVFETNKTIR